MQKLFDDLPEGTESKFAESLEKFFSFFVTFIRSSKTEIVTRLSTCVTFEFSRTRSDDPPERSKRIGSAQDNVALSFAPASLAAF